MTTFEKEQYFVPDTNIFLSDPTAIDQFKPQDKNIRNTVVLPMQVIAEIDEKKNESHSDRGFAARETLRLLKERIRESGSNLLQGVDLEPNYRIIASTNLSQGTDVIDAHDNTPDSRIIQVVSDLQRAGHKTTFVTNDTGAYVIANALGLHTESWREKEVEATVEPYKGWRALEIDPNLFFDKVHHNRGEVEVKHLPMDGLEGLLPNEFVIFTGNRVETTALRHIDGRLHRLYHYEGRQSKVKAKNVLQQCYMDVLRDEDIDVVFCMGEAGTAKTYLATDAAIELCFTDEVARNAGKRPIAHHTGDELREFAKLLITRPAVNENNRDVVDLGAIPGDLTDKMMPWVAPIYDQIEQLAETYKIDADMIEDLKKEGLLEILVTTHMRGRSLTNAYWVLDEGQNTSFFQLRTAMTRVGEGTKMVLTGDPKQCDLKGIADRKNNSLVIANERWKSYKGAATIYFQGSEYVVRSRLAQEAVNRMQ